MLALIIAVRLLMRMPTSKESKSSIKKAAARLVRQLRDSAGWDDLMYEIYVRQAIEAGISDSDTGRTQDVKAVRTRLGLAE